MVALVAHKYMPEEMPVEELEATFAARQHTLDYLVGELHKQSAAGTPTNFLITGPRGSGKTTIVLMLCHRINQDALLSAAWLPVRFREEQFDVVSLRDLLEKTLQILAEERSNALAKDWLEKVVAESDDDQSQELAIGGLRQITQRQQKRLILIVENLDMLLGRLTERAQATLRRLLMTDPFMLIVGTAATKVFDELRQYDKALFNYFCEVALDRLNDAQVRELLLKRAEYDGNANFKHVCENERPKIRALCDLIGGNPRFVLMMYELLSQCSVLPIVQMLRRLIDELTPMLKDVLESLPPNQARIIDAIMQSGGVAQPTELSRVTRLPLNAVTTQLTRLKTAQRVEVRGGGKGRAAYYAIPDPLFRVWYQMRYLRAPRRRIELFVEVLRIWFTAEERMAALNALAGDGDRSAGRRRDTVETADYFAASLADTEHAGTARDLAVGAWLRQGELREAALALTELDRTVLESPQSSESATFARLAGWSAVRGDYPTSVAAMQAALQAEPENAVLRLLYAKALYCAGEYTAAINALDQVPNESMDTEHRVDALMVRASSKWRVNELAGAIADYTAVIGLVGAAVQQKATALNSRGIARRQFGDTAGQIEDCTKVIGLAGAPVGEVAMALVNRGAARGQTGDINGAIEDFMAVVGLAGAPVEQVARALNNRGFARLQSGDCSGAIEDYTAVVNLAGARVEEVALALVIRAAARRQLGDTAGAIQDCTAVVELAGVRADVHAVARLNRGATRLALGDSTTAIGDFLAVVESAQAPLGSCLEASRLAFRSAWTRGNNEQAQAALDLFRRRVGDLQADQRAEHLVTLLGALTEPPMRSGWPHALRLLTHGQPTEVRDKLAFFEPVARILEGADPSLLDPLPPEQGFFAKRLLERFGIPVQRPEPLAAPLDTLKRRRTRASKNRPQRSARRPTRKPRVARSARNPARRV